MPETSGACTAGLLFIVDSLVGAPFSTLFFVAAIGAKLRRLASSAASCFLTHRKCGFSEPLFYQLYACISTATGSVAHAGDSRAGEGRSCVGAPIRTQAVSLARAQSIVHNARMDVEPSFPSPAPWMFADLIYGLGNCLIARDGRVIGV